MEDKIVEITAEEQNKVKRMKKKKKPEIVSETSWTILNTQTFELLGLYKKRKRKGMRNFLKRL